VKTEAAVLVDDLDDGRLMELSPDGQPASLLARTLTVIEAPVPSLFELGWWVSRYISGADRYVFLSMRVQEVPVGHFGGDFGRIFGVQNGCF